MTKILVTGATGFLGSEIVRQAVADHLPMRTTSRRMESIIPDVDYYPADILDLSSLNSIFRDVSLVIHAAGLAHIFDKAKADTASFKTINEQGTVNVTRLAAIAGVRHFVLISSVSVYGPFTQCMVDESASCHPKGPYAESKYQAEQRSIEIAQQFGMPLTILRLATLYGEGDPGNVGRLMRSLAKGRFLWIGDGRNRKSLLYRGDAARACLAAMSAPPNGVAIYNVSAPPSTMHEIVEGLTDELGTRPLPVRVPAAFVISATRLLSGLPPSRFSSLHATVKKWLAEDVYDTHRIEAAIGFRTQVSLTDGLQREVQWYRNHQAK